MGGTDKALRRPTILACFLRKEIAQLIDALECLEEMDPARRADFNLSDDVLKRIRFKLWRLLDVDYPGTK